MPYNIIKSAYESLNLLLNPESKMAQESKPTATKSVQTPVYKLPEGKLFERPQIGTPFEGGTDTFTVMAGKGTTTERSTSYSGGTSYDISEGSPMYLAWAKNLALQGFSNFQPMPGQGNWYDKVLNVYDGEMRRNQFGGITGGTTPDKAFKIPDAWVWTGQGWSTPSEMQNAGWATDPKDQAKWIQQSALDNLAQNTKDRKAELDMLQYNYTKRQQGKGNEQKLTATTQKTSSLLRPGLAASDTRTYSSGSLGTPASSYKQLTGG